MKEDIRLVAGEETVVMLVNGKLTADFPPQVARQLAAALLQQAQLIDNEKRAKDNPQAIIDQAILMRAGSGIGLFGNNKAIDEAHKEAQWNRDLRRYMPTPISVQSKEKFGLPTIRGGKQ